jgi:hypothetical protein
VNNLTATQGDTVTLYAKWTAAQYTITYNYDGADGGNSSATATATYGAAYTLAVPTKSYNTFAAGGAGQAVRVRSTPTRTAQALPTGTARRASPSTPSGPRRMCRKLSRPLEPPPATP